MKTNVIPHTVKITDHTIIEEVENTEGPIGYISRSHQSNRHYFVPYTHVKRGFGSVTLFTIMKRIENLDAQAR